MNSDRSDRTGLLVVAGLLVFSLFPRAFERLNRILRGPPRAGDRQ